MVQPGLLYRKVRQEQGKISLWLIGFLGISPIAAFMFIIIVMNWPPSTTPDAVPSEVKQEVLSITDEAIGKYIEISKLKDDRNTYSVDIELLSEPETDNPEKKWKPAKKWTEVVCQKCHTIFENHGIKRDINVWAYYSKSLYGRTSYTEETGKTEFKNADELKTEEDSKDEGTTKDADKSKSKDNSEDEEKSKDEAKSEK